MNRVRRQRRSRALLAGALAIGASALQPVLPAAADAPETQGVALLVGVDRYLGRPAGTSCEMAATSLRDRLRAAHFTVETLLDPDAVALRSAIGDFAAQLAGAPSGTTLIYLCGVAAADGTRLFVLPADVDPATAELQTQGIVLQAPLNALAQTGGTLYADLDLARGGPGSIALESLGQRLPHGLHAAVQIADGDAPLAHRLESSGLDASKGWDTVAGALAATHGLAPGPLVAYLPPLPVPAAPVPPPLAAPAASTPSPSKPVTRPPIASPPPGPPAAASDALTVEADPGKDHPDDTSPATPATKSAPAHPHATTRRRPPPRINGNSRVVRLQDALARVGFYHGTPNGQIDQTTLDGIRAFQRKLGDPPTGVMTGAEIVRLLNS